MGDYSEILDREGYLIVSPVSGSMRPMIREKRDTVLLEPYRGKVQRGDVLLFRRGKDFVLHRAIKPIPGGWFTRGDHSYVGEHIPNEQILGKMRGFYRDEQYISAESICYQVYARWIMRLHPLLTKMWRTRIYVRKFVKRCIE